ncbi:hypothetical protein J1614_007208 [Plenodomus biglobosus]|nr:hypothetical protein J1614_007208 [Plenodomus biglobosus]
MAPGAIPRGLQSSQCHLRVCNAKTTSVLQSVEVPSLCSAHSQPIRALHSSSRVTHGPDFAAQIIVPTPQNSRLVSEYEQRPSQQEKTPDKAIHQASDEAQFEHHDLSSTKVDRLQET